MNSTIAGGRKGISTQAIAIWAAIVLLGGWACFNWFSTLTRISELCVGIPVEDYWRVAAHVNDIRHFDFRYLWQQHNEHRIVFPDIVFALDVLLFHGQRLLPIAVSFLCYLGSWAILAWLLIQEARLSRSSRILGALLTAILLGWKGCAPVLADPFLLNWTMLEGTALAALFFASGVSANTTVWPMIAMAVVATYSSANGLLLWLVLLAAGYLLGFTKRQMTTLAVSAVVADGLYFVGYRFTGDAHLLTLARHPLDTLCFIAAYLSMPFGGMKSPQFGLYVGFLNLGLTVLFFIVALREGLLRKRLAVVLFGYYAFTLMTALLIAAGRMEVGDATFTAARATRYLAPVMITWGVFVALAIWMAGTRMRGAMWTPILASVLAILLAISFVKLRWFLRSGSSGFSGEQIAELSMENQVMDPRLLRSIFPDPGFIEHYLPALKAAHLSIFYKDKSKWLGKSVSQFGVMLPPVDGAVTRIFPVISGFEFTGWAGEGRHFPFKEVFLVNDSGRVIGFGRRPPDGLPSELLSSGMPAGLGWIAFVSEKYAAGKFSVYLADGRGVSPIREQYEFPAVTAVAAEQVGKNVPGVKWGSDAAWSAGGTGPYEHKGGAPAGEIYGSWNGSDAHTGEIASSAFAVPAGDCVVVPVLHGPATKNLAVEIVDANTGKTIGRVPMLDVDVQWEFWRIPIAAATERIEIRARDVGRGFGEWLGVATPDKCR